MDHREPPDVQALGEPLVLGVLWDQLEDLEHLEPQVLVEPRELLEHLVRQELLEDLVPQVRLV